MAEQPLFSDGDNIKHRGTGELGLIAGDPRKHGGEYWYRVRFSNRKENIPEDDLDALSDDPATPIDLAAEGAWGQLATFRSALATERIRSTNRSTVYTYRSQRILFEPYQYKPLLKLLDSHDRRLLIADEVGLGKTIEAGLILAEMDARTPLDRVLVICPSRLRDKWREELNRKFDQDFEIFDGQDVRRYAEKVASNSKKTKLRAIASLNTLRSEAMRSILRDEIGQLDLIIFDEAHHCRNPSTSTSRLLRDLCDISNAAILLSATPIQLRTRDLFTLLNALRPDEFRDPNVFEEELQHYAVVHETTRLVRSSNVERLPDIVGQLRQCFVKNIANDEQDPIARQVIADIQANEPKIKRDWVELERRITDLHPLSSLLSRTRKRDVIDNAPTRRAEIITCHWTAAEEQQYESFVGKGVRNGWFKKSAGFAQISRARRAASCLPAAISAEPLPVKIDDDNASESIDILPSELTASSNSESSSELKAGHDNLVDSKFERLQELVCQIQQKEPGTKILMFTFFRGTAKYLQKKLEESGFKSLYISGEVVSDPRHPERDERGKVVRTVSREPRSKGISLNRGWQRRARLSVLPPCY